MSPRCASDNRRNVAHSGRKCKHGVAPEGEYLDVYPDHGRGRSIHVVMMASRKLRKQGCMVQFKENSNGWGNLGIWPARRRPTCSPRAWSAPSELEDLHFRPRYATMRSTKRRDRSSVLKTSHVMSRACLRSFTLDLGSLRIRSMRRRSTILPSRPSWHLQNLPYVPLVGDTGNPRNVCGC